MFIYFMPRDNGTYRVTVLLPHWDCILHLMICQAFPYQTFHYMIYDTHGSPLYEITKQVHIFNFIIKDAKCSANVATK